MTRFRWWRETVPVVMFFVVGSLGATSTVATATPLGSGDYTITSGDLIGGTFSIGTDSLFASWNLTFPATSFSSLINFTSPSPPPDISGVAGTNRIGFDDGIARYSVSTGLSPMGTTFDYQYGIRSLSSRDGVSGGGQGALQAPPIPEPSTLLLFGTGLAGLGVWRYRKSLKT